MDVVIALAVIVGENKDGVGDEKEFKIDGD